jgi:hypothetical protein
LTEKLPIKHTHFDRRAELSLNHHRRRLLHAYSFKCASRLRLMKEKTSISSIILLNLTESRCRDDLNRETAEANHNGTNWSIFTPRFRERENRAPLFEESFHQIRKTSTNLRHFFMMFIFATLL